VCRTAIGDSRILSVSDTHVSFRWKDRSNNNSVCVDKITGQEFVERYLRHVLPRGLRAVRYFGFCHPAAKAKRERIAFHTGRPLLIGAAAKPPEKPPHVVLCPCCGEPMKKVLSLLPAWRPSRAPPPMKKRICARMLLDLITQSRQAFSKFSKPTDKAIANYVHDVEKWALQSCIG